MESAEEQVKRLAANTAYALGIPVYIRDGRIFQTPPGERVDPAPGATPTITDRIGSLPTAAE